VYDYVKWGVNAVQGDFEMPDNLRSTARQPRTSSGGSRDRA
jgi:hypothetical protein